MKTLFCTVVLTFGLFGLNLLFAQESIEVDTSKTWSIELVNENVYIGKIISRDQEKIVFDTEELGVIDIRVVMIKKMKEIEPEQVVDGAYWFDNPQSTRYFWAPAGYGLKKGEGYYQNVLVFFNQVAFGVSDNFSIGMGVVPLFMFGGVPSPVWLTPKVSIPIAEKAHIGAGALLGYVIGADDAAFGIAYGTTTLGTRDKNITIGLGYGYAGGDWANSPTITLATMIRTGKRGYFISENYLIGVGDYTTGIISGGGRIVGKKLSFDFGLGIPINQGSGGFVTIPWLGIALPFGGEIN